MINIKVKEFKIKLNDEEYTFRLDFKALMRFEEKYKYTEDEEGNMLTKDAMVLFNEFLQGQKVYENIIKILSCCCVEKEIEEGELSSLLSFDFKTMKLMDEITFTLIEGMMEKKEGTEGKNEVTNQADKKE